MFLMHPLCFLSSLERFFFQPFFTFNCSNFGKHSYWPAKKSQIWENTPIGRPKTNQPIELFVELRLWGRCSAWLFFRMIPSPLNNIEWSNWILPQEGRPLSVSFQFRTSGKETDMATMLRLEKYGRIDFSLGRWVPRYQNAPKSMRAHAKLPGELAITCFRSLSTP